VNCDAIPITTAKAIATTHGYDQVIVYARRVGEPGLEWVTTYGRDKAHCDAAARIGAAIGQGVVKPLERLRTALEDVAGIAAWGTDGTDTAIMVRVEEALAGPTARLARA
jgi:hypothetical protein